MKKRSLLIFSLYLLGSQILLAQTWTQVGYLINGNGDTIPGNNVKFIKGFGSDMFIGTRKGLFKSTDMGTSWNNITYTTLPASQIKSLLVASDNFLYMGADSTFYKSSNGGSSWTQQSIVPAIDSAEITDIVETSPNGYFVASYNSTMGGGVVYSNNYGATWTVATGITSTVGFLFVDGTTLYLGGMDNGVYKSTDNGASWSVDSVGIEPSSGVNQVIRYNGNLYANSYYGKGMYVSTDNAATWSAVAFFKGGSFCQTFSLVENSTGFYTGPSGSFADCNKPIVRSNDGISWSRYVNGMDTLTISFFAKLGASSDKAAIFTVDGFSGMVYRLGNSTANIHEMNWKNSFAMYPNPANEQITLMGIPTGSTLRLMDVSGKTMQTKFISQSIEKLDLSSYNKGIYILRIEHNGEIVNRKLIVE